MIRKVEPAVPKNTYTFPWRVIGKSKVVVESREFGTKLEFPQGWGGAKQKPFHGRGIGIFWDHTMFVSL